MDAGRSVNPDALVYPLIALSAACTVGLVLVPSRTWIEADLNKQWWVWTTGVMSLFCGAGLLSGLLGFAMIAVRLQSRGDRPPPSASKHSQYGNGRSEGANPFLK